MFQFFTLKFDQYDGNLQDYTATVFYMPWKNFGFGAGGNEFRTNVNISNNASDGNLAWRYGGCASSSGRPTDTLATATLRLTFPALATVHGLGLLAHGRGPSV